MPGVRLAISPDVFALFRGLRVAVVVATGVDNRSVNHGVESLLHDAWRDAARLELPNPQSHPRVAAWREAFRSIGVSPRDFPSSIEALLRRAMKGGEPLRIGPLVDLYNAVSLGHLVPAGGFDLAGIDGDRTELERLAAENVKRVVRNGDGQSPWHAAAFLELKTVWHPIGV
jgi:DNA/RNA-binding domain of Phe-tRNA-synthetase-like protein